MYFLCKQNLKVEENKNRRGKLTEYKTAGLWF
jgi:hypothetical protein